VKATNVVVAQAAILDRLQDLTATGGPLEGVQVKDLYGRDMGEKCVYGGGGRFVQSEASAERGLTKFETDTVGLYLRIYRAGRTAREAKLAVDALGDAVATALAGQPQLGSGLTWVGVIGGQLDVYTTDDAYETILALQCQVEGYLQ
jgi:hypothetical protein